MEKFSNFIERTDRYLQIGKDPKRLATARTHGNELEIGEIIDEYVDTNISRLSSLLYVPEVSPSAAKLHTRENANGLDLNRSFFNNSTDSEVKFVIDLLTKYKFETAISFHEDPELDVFYLYDAYGPDLEGTETLKKIREEITALGVGLLNGVDDPNDSTLGDTFVDGYKYYPANAENIDPSSGFFADWAYGNGIIKRYLNPEIPGKLDKKIKKQIVEILLKYLIPKT